nr:MAG TPA: hypothetical protein [Caudoviricetes sp.]
MSILIRECFSILMMNILKRLFKSDLSTFCIILSYFE